MRSVGVAVGEERLSVSEINPAMSNPAVDAGWISTAFCWYNKRDDGAGRADRIVPEVDGRVGGETAEPMVVDHLDDRQAVRTVDGLGLSSL